MCNGMCKTDIFNSYFDNSFLISYIFTALHIRNPLNSRRSSRGAPNELSTRLLNLFKLIQFAKLTPRLVPIFEVQNKLLDFKKQNNFFKLYLNMKNTA